MRFRCNCCGELPSMFEFEADAPVCPQCGATGVPYVVPLIDVHFVILDSKGPIPGQVGRQKIACEPTREHLGLGPLTPYAATGEIEAVTCPRCRGTRDYQERASKIEHLRIRLEQEMAGRKATGRKG